MLSILRDPKMIEAIRKSKATSVQNTEAASVKVPSLSQAIANKKVITPNNKVNAAVNNNNLARVTTPPLGNVTTPDSTIGGQVTTLDNTTGNVVTPESTIGGQVTTPNSTVGGQVVLGGEERFSSSDIGISKEGLRNNALYSLDLLTDKKAKQKLPQYQQSYIAPQQARLKGSRNELTRNAERAIKSNRGSDATLNMMGALGVQANLNESISQENQADSVNAQRENIRVASALDAENKNRLNYDNQIIDIKNKAEAANVTADNIIKSNLLNLGADIVYGEEQDNAKLKKEQQQLIQLEEAKSQSDINKQAQEIQEEYSKVDMEKNQYVNNYGRQINEMMRATGARSLSQLSDENVYQSLTPEQQKIVSNLVYFDEKTAEVKKKYDDLYSVGLDNLVQNYGEQLKTQRGNAGLFNTRREYTPYASSGFKKGGKVKETYEAKDWLDKEELRLKKEKLQLEKEKFEDSKLKDYIKDLVKINKRNIARINKLVDSINKD